MGTYGDTRRKEISSVQLLLTFVVMKMEVIVAK